MLVGKAESCCAALSVSTFPILVNCLWYYLNFKILLLRLCANYSIICSLPDSLDLSIDFPGAVIKVPSAMAGRSCQVDTPRQIRPDSSLKWAVTEHEAQ